MASLLDTKRRIKSIKSTRQITKAMEKISAIKMKKSQAATLRSRRYASLAWEMLERLGGDAQVSAHPLWEQRETVRAVGMVVISTDRGLCGGLNAKLSQSVIAACAERNIPPAEVKVYAVGKKCREILMRLGFSVQADFGAVPAFPDAAFARNVIQTVVEDYQRGVIDKVFAAYTDFINTLSQKPVLHQLLPLSRTDVKNDSLPQQAVTKYVFEPSVRDVLHHLITRILESRMYQNMLEGSASEHSARMVAMKNATDNASDLVNELTLIYNQARQASITREIAEISAGRIALEG